MTHPQDNHAVCVHHLHVHQGSHHTLQDISFTIDSGESVVIRGSNGSGKTTLVRTLLGLIPVTSGSILMANHPHDGTGSHGSHKERIGYVPQFGAPGLHRATVNEVLTLGLPAKRSPRTSQDAITQALEATDLVPQRHRLYGQLSGGQQKRVLIARAIMMNPQVLLIDEPLAGVDAANQGAITTLIQTMMHQHVTVLAVLHDPGPLMDIMQRELHLADGQLTYDGPNRHIGATP